MLLALSNAFLGIMLLHILLALAALFWAWRRGHLTREKFPIETILELEPEDPKEMTDVEQPRRA
ncbi:MAG: hypothetical protein QNJ98_06770 [Planctomycetota bacterium]|nr:hypothetical protein [Planctomycetota bacterium]